MAEKTNANIGFEKQLWDAACVLWGHIPAAEYRKVIIGLIFLRYISAAFDRQREKLIAEGDGFEDDRDAYEMDNVFFVPEEARWNNISSKAHTPEIGTIIDNAMRAIEAENKKLKNVLPKNYASPDLDKQVLGDVVDIFTNNIDMSDATASELLFIHSDTSETSSCPDISCGSSSSRSDARLRFSIRFAITRSYRGASRPPMRS